MTANDIKSTNKKDKDKNIDYKNYAFFILIFLISLTFLYFLIYPTSSGIIGKFVSEKFLYIFGKSSYFLPILGLITSLRLITPAQINYKILLLGFLLAVVFIATFIEAAFGKESGGALGFFTAELLLTLVGKTGVYLISLLFIVIGLYILNFQFFVKSVVYSTKLVKSIYMFIKNRSASDTKIDNPEKTVIEEAEDLPLKTVDIVEEKQKKPKKSKKVKPKNDINLLHQFEGLDKNPKIVVENVDEKQEQEYILPSVDLLDKVKPLNAKVSQKELKENAAILQRTLENFGISAVVSNIIPGPVITRYEIELAAGVKVGSIVNLKNDICLAMKAHNVMILAPIPGKAAVGVEVPNINKEQVVFREFVESSEFSNTKMILPFALGKTVSGKIYITDIAKTPHLLIAGSTGSGKSVCINTLIMSILFSKKPDEVKFIMVDPKVVELSYYKEIPHLYNPVITNPKEASKVLQYVVFEMEKRYEKYAEAGVRNIESYNDKMKTQNKEKDFYLVVIIDELADLMLVASKDVEESIVRLTQKARAVGIHVVLATQRPSVNVITGIIKANLPSRIAFQVISKTDSRVILDMNGAEDLLGRGDMLFLENGASKTMRMQGAFLSETEVQRVIKFVKSQATPDFSTFSKMSEATASPQNNAGKDGDKDLIRALELVLERR